jgi:hypothetical protein
MVNWQWFSNLFPTDFAEKAQIKQVFNSAKISAISGNKSSY